MLHKIDVSFEIDVKKTNESRKWTIFNYYYILKINFRFQPKVYDGCRDLMQKVMSFNNVSNASVNILFWHMSKDKAINIMINFDLKEEKNIPKNLKICSLLKK